MMRRHAELLSEHMGEERGCKEFRKHITWYLKGFPAGGELRHQLALVDSLASLDALLAGLDATAPFPERELGTPRGRQGAPRARWCSPTGGWTTPTGAARTCARTSTRPPGAEPAPRIPSRGTRWNLPGKIGTGRVSCASLDDSRHVVINFPSRDAATSPVSKCKGSALWLSIATSGKPLLPPPVRSRIPVRPRLRTSPSWRRCPR